VLLNALLNTVNRVVSKSLSLLVNQNLVEFVHQRLFSIRVFVARAESLFKLNAGVNMVEVLNSTVALTVMSHFSEVLR
jgi:hypothetical protein